uniref:Alginate lyase n=1 Tax=Littorina brevicula TaxID=45748 RepID=G9MBE4_9CAEN|nr:alginate lyase [Littorina brevicula]
MLSFAVLFLLIAVRADSRSLSNDTLHLPYKRAGSELVAASTFHSGSQMLADFKPQALWGENSLSVASDPAGGSGNVLRVHYDKGSYSKTHDKARGAAFYSHVTSSHTAMMLSYDIFFSSNFDFVKGGKLPGLWGGTTTGTCTGGHRADTCFTTRFMWRADGQGEVYAYIPKTQRSDFCDDSHVECNDHYGNSLGRGTWHFKKNHWQNIAQYVHLNTPGKTDGYIRVFLDGHKVYEIKDIAVRAKDSVKIDGMIFSTFFGGSDSEWASKQSCYTYFRNFVLSMDSSHPTIIG